MAQFLGQHRGCLCPVPPPSLISPFVPTHSPVSCCPGDEGCLPHHPHSPEPSPSSGTAILQLQALSWPSGPQWPRTWSAGTLQLPGAGGTGCAEPSWTPRGCCQLPIPDRLGPAVGATVPWQCSPELGKPFPGFFLQAAEPGQQSLPCAWGTQAVAVTSACWQPLCSTH